MLSKMCKTGIKAVIYLCSQRREQRYIGIKQIAKSINSSEHTVGKLLQLLVKDQIIGSVKGPSGGYFITPEQGDNPILKIIEAIDGPDRLMECGLGLSRCSAQHPCPLHAQYEPIRSAMEKMFREKKVGDLCHAVDCGVAFLAG